MGFMLNPVLSIAHATRTPLVNQHSFNRRVSHQLQILSIAQRLYVRHTALPCLELRFERAGVARRSAQDPT